MIHRAQEGKTYPHRSDMIMPRLLNLTEGLLLTRGQDQVIYLISENRLVNNVFKIGEKEGISETDTLLLLRYIINLRKTLRSHPAFG